MRKKRRLKVKIRTFLTFAIAIVLFGYISFSVINYDISKKKFELEEQELQGKLHELKDQEVDLNQEISKLKDDDYLARYAREEYLYSKDGEYVIKIDEKKDETIESTQSEMKVSGHFIIFNVLLIMFIIALPTLFIMKLKKIPKKKVSVAWYFL